MTYPLPGPDSPPLPTPRPSPTGPRSTPLPLLDMLFGDVIAARAAFDRLKSPARRPPHLSPAGGPVQATRRDAGEMPTPGSAAAFSGVARESTGAVVAAGAGASSGPLPDRAVEASPAYGSAGPQGTGLPGMEKITLTPVDLDTITAGGTVTVTLPDMTFEVTSEDGWGGPAVDADVHRFALSVRDLDRLGWGREVTVLPVGLSGSVQVMADASAVARLDHDPERPGGGSWPPGPPPHPRPAQ